MPQKRMISPEICEAPNIRGLRGKQWEKQNKLNKEKIGRVKLSNTRELVASIVDGEKLDLSLEVDSNNYKGWTKQGLRFYLFDDNWPEFRKLIDKVDKEYEEIA